MCHLEWCHKICNQTFSYRFIVAAIMDEKSNIFWCSSISIYLLINVVKTVEGLFEMHLHAKFTKKKKKKKKKNARQENRVLTLNAENSRSVTHVFMFAYANEKILLSVLIISLFLYHDFNLNTQGYVYLELVNYQLGLHRNLQVFVKCNVCISTIVVLYTDMSRLSSYIDINRISFRF